MAAPVVEFAPLDCFHRSTIMEAVRTNADSENVARYADMLTALGTEPRLRIMRLLLSAHPNGMVVGEIQAELEMSASTLSHHLERLKHEGLAQVRREGTFLRYSANTDALTELLAFLYSECCARSGAVKAAEVIALCK